MSVKAKRPIRIRTRYYFILLTQQELFHNLVLEELFRERANCYNAYEIEFDFWILLRPKFITDLYPKILENTLYYTLNKNEIKDGESNYFAIILTRDYHHISWLKLRLGYFEPVLFPSYLTPDQNQLVAELSLKLSEENSSFDQKELKENQKELEKLKVYTTTNQKITINGVYGEIWKENLPNQYSLLDYPKRLEDQLHPKILIKQYSDLLLRMKKLKNLNQTFQVKTS